MACLLEACASDVVTLRNGFAVTCRSHQQVGTGTVRLYLRQDTAVSDTSGYMDVPVESVVSIETSPEVVQPLTEPTAEPKIAQGSAASLYHSLLQHSGSVHNVNAALLASVVQAESAGNPRAVSRTGARGLMQLMPGTAAEHGIRDSFAPAQNLDGGSAYLDELLTRYHDNLTLALAAYNAGPAAVDRYHGVPPYRETRLYVARVVREFNRLVRMEAERASVSTAAVLPGMSH